MSRETIVKYASILDDWDDAAEDCGLVHELLEGMTLERGRIVIAARQEDHERLSVNRDWLEEPVYKTLYAVEKLDAGLISKVCVDTPHSILVSLGSRLGTHDVFNSLRTPR